MIFKRDVLLNAINMLKPGLTPNAIVDAMQNVFFTKNDILAYNEQILIMVPFETDFKASVNYEDLINILNKLDSHQFEMGINNETELRIKAESTDAGLLLTSTKEIDGDLDAVIEQMPNDSNNLEWTVLPNDFVNGMLLCIMAADTSLQLQSLACLYANGTELLCTDNMRVSHYTLDGDLNAEFFIRTGLIKELEKFAVTHFCATKSWVFFTTEDGIIFAAKKLYAESLNIYMSLFDGFKGKGVKLPEGLKEVVNAASVMASDTDRKNMDIVIKDDEMICTSQNQRGWVTKRIPMKTVGKKPIELQVSALYLQQILDLPDLMMTVGENKSLFTSGSFRHVLLHRVEE